MERTKEGLKERIRAGRGKIAAEKVIKRRTAGQRYVQ